MIEEQVIPNLQSLYSQECGRLPQLSSAQLGAARSQQIVSTHISCGNELPFNHVFLKTTRAERARGVNAQRLFLYQDDAALFFSLPGVIPVTSSTCVQP